MSTEMKEEVKKLLPCPFCGGKAEQDEVDEDDGGGEYVCCVDCGARTARFFRSTPEPDRKRLMFAAWNIRPQLAQLTRERDQAFAALKPFADYGADFLKEAHIPDNESLPWLVGRTAKITYRQLRAAALAMGKEK